MTASDAATNDLQGELATLRQLLEVQEELAHSYVATIKRQQSEIERRSRELSELNATLQQTTGLLAEIHRTMPCALMVVDQAGYIETVNEGALSLLGYSEAELVGSHLSAVLAPGDVPHMDSIETLPTEGHVLRTEKECVAKGGRSIPVLFSASTMACGDGASQASHAVVCIILDIRERKRLEIELRQAQRLESIGQMAAGIAHEINTPMQYLGDNIRFLQEAFGELQPVIEGCRDSTSNTRPTAGESSLNTPGNLRPDDIEYMLREIPEAIDQSIKGVQSVSKIVRSMKEFAHPSAEAKQAADLNRAIENTLTVTRSAWKHIAELQAELAPDLPLVHCLPAEMNQVLLNLFVNAAHAMESKLGPSPQAKGTLTVRTRREGGTVIIEVQDTGTGIPESIRDRVFDPFFTTKEVGRGSGQGLAIARSIVVDHHGGTISFETEHGRGTTFAVRIPIGSSADLPETTHAG